MVLLLAKKKAMGAVFVEFYFLKQMKEIKAKI